MLSLVNKIKLVNDTHRRRIWLERVRLNQQQNPIKRQSRNLKKPRKKAKPRKANPNAFYGEKYEARINYYLGEVFKQNPPLHLKEDRHSETFMKLSKCKNKTRTWQKYVGSFLLLLTKTNNRSKAFKLITGDNALHRPVGTLVKTRNNQDRGSVIIRCLNFERHWHNYYNRPADIPFDNKKSAVIWRGTTTGRETGVSRFNLVKTWFNKHPKIDVGFSSICQMKAAYNNYVKGHKEMHDLLKYKYILSVEGNDKDTGINWKLNSNSLVFMAKPSVSSWLMESTLIPNYHYILLKDDFSDLLEKVIWCDYNETKCKQMIINANTFMRQFNNKGVEKNIEKALINRYFELTGQTLKVSRINGNSNIIEKSIRAKYDEVMDQLLKVSRNDLLKKASEINDNSKVIEKGVTSEYDEVMDQLLKVSRNDLLEKVNNKPTGMEPIIIKANRFMNENANSD